MSDFEYLGPYRVEAKLGQGGMGTVYRGVHAKNGQRVAIKVLASRMAQEQRFRRRFDAEIETLKRLNHPNIVKLIGFGEEQGHLFYSMELIEGPSLLEHLRKVKRLDWDTTIGYAIEICSALKHAHDIGVIHRDLKPANLLLEPEGRIKLTDFGIAKLFGANEQTAAGSVLGTADYMAPEQASGDPVTPRTDLYALGSLMYACLVGRPPFGGRSLTQVVHGLKHETPAPLDLVLPECPPELAELVHELLEKSPEDRPPTALVVGKRLGALRAGFRRRGEQTHVDLGAPTLIEGEQLPNVPTSKAPAATPARRPRSEGPTAIEDGTDTPTGDEYVLAPTLASEAADGRSLTHTTATQEQEAIVPRTRFETVSGGTSTLLHPNSSDNHRDTTQWLSIAGLIATLLGTIVIIFWLLRDPSPADLLARVEQAEASGNRRDLEVAVKQFLKLYPEDARAETLRESLELGNVEQMSRRLRTRATLVGGIELMDPAEQSWLLAMDLRDRQPQRALEQLQAWLTVFDHSATETTPVANSEALDKLILLARSEVNRLKENPRIELDARAQQLETWIAWGIENLQGDDLKEFVNGVKLLYGDKSWATPALEKLP